MPSNNKPLIGITSEYIVHKTYANRHQSALYENYTNAVIQTGGIPVIIPVTTEPDVLEGMIERLDGVVFCGGDDIPSKYYGQEQHPSVDPLPDEAYESYAMLTKLLMQRTKPLLAICAGHQVVNVCNGGTLIQDIASSVDTKINHVAINLGQDSLHMTDIHPGSKLAEILGEGPIETNSAHHQAYDKVADVLTVSAHCPDDNIVEAAEIPGHPFFVVVQWHPERIMDKPAGVQVFEAFIAAARGS